MDDNIPNNVYNSMTQSYDFQTYDDTGPHLDDLYHKAILGVNKETCSVAYKYQ